MAAGDTFRAAAGDQLEIWADRTGCEIVRAEKENAKASAGREIFAVKSTGLSNRIDCKNCQACYNNEHTI